MPEPSSSSPAPADLARRAAQLCLDMKANDVVMLNLKGVSDMTDYFVIASGTSDTHVRSMAEHVMEELKKDGAPVHHAEGVTQGRWALLDYVDFVVHVFHPTLRQFYQLERLWSDAEAVAVEQHHALERALAEQRQGRRGGGGGGSEARPADGGRSAPRRREDEAQDNQRDADSQGALK
ncbi:MAG: ribosome silencing factor [Gemmatimonadaceae bacterium]